MPFEIFVHPGDAIIELVPIVEVIYPPNPTPEDIQAYVARAHEVIDAQHGRPFCCIADQRAVRVMTPELVAALGELNTYAYAHGMLRTARLVSSTIAELQTRQLARENRFEVEAFESRNAALLWLREKET
jgi:hypothetical protein